MKWFVVTYEHAVHDNGITMHERVLARNADHAEELFRAKAGAQWSILEVEEEEAW